MIEAKQNLYKMAGVFRCIHDVHRHFKSELSPFYILSEKNCYPDGCVYFKWTCRLLAKQKTCFRGFSNVGRKCFNCRYFYEEKQHHFPEYVKEDDQYLEFKERFDEFEAWVDDLLNQRVMVEGVVTNVLPSLSIRSSGPNPVLGAHGFLVYFEQGYIKNNLFNDNFYLSVSALTQNKIQFREGDSLEFEASLSINRGRFKFTKPGRIQFFERGNGPVLKKSDILVALKTYSVQKGQPAKCLHCAHGILVDQPQSDRGPSRSMVCLEGVADFQLCPVSIQSAETVKQETCINSEWRGKNCHHVL